MAELSSCCSFDSRFSSWADPGSSDIGPDGWQFKASSMDSARDFTCLEKESSSSVMSLENSPDVVTELPPPSMPPPQEPP